MVRAPCFDKYGIKKGAWSEDEDNKLRAYIHTYGHPNWRELPKLAGLSRCGKSCRLRWMNYLRPNVKHGNFTKEEEDVIIRVHNKIGNKWSKMAALLPGRSDNEIKNHWHTHLKNEVQKDHTELKNAQVKDQVVKGPCLLKNEQSSGSFESQYMNPKACRIMNTNLSTTQQEVEILVAVLSYDSTSSSSTSESSPCSLSVSDYAIPSDVAPQISDTTGNFWNEPFLADEGSIISSSDELFSPLDLADDLMISQDSLQDYIFDDVFLWSS
ncbi:hypothetical protein QVD17_03726 [Tagetes erecta]|uniref:Uncharacterized protein n=1 Tax=Tagetes erecta TaxID=13708 RepID=A0AAD8PA65_TARER|nr:hypothetical protein QVD17_03726 [Tagetes erecta]